MSSTETRHDSPGDVGVPPLVDMNLEVVLIAVTDVGRAKAFYAGLGWRLDADVARGDQFRLVQFTPPGSGCSLQFGAGLTTAVPGSAPNPYLVVDDIGAARASLVAHGVAVDPVFHEGTLGDRFHPADRVDGPAPDGTSYGSFASFSDPDGNRWLLQEVTSRLPGRVDQTATTFASTTELAAALRRAEAAHGEHEARTGTADANWPDWYAEFIVREQSGEAPPT